jgi:hypothetical protein
MGFARKVIRKALIEQVKAANKKQPKGKKYSVSLVWKNMRRKKKSEQIEVAAEATPEVAPETAPEAETKK